MDSRALSEVSFPGSDRTKLMANKNNEPQGANQMMDRTLRGHLRRRGLLAMVVGLAGVAGVAAAFGAPSCDAVKQLAIEHTAIDAAQPIPAGGYQAPGGMEIKDVPAFCRVHGVISPVPGSQIGFELWLPDAGWNGKLEMFGNGGYSSKIAYGNLAEQLKRGYAVLGTDTGHSGDDPAFAAGHPEAIVDWGNRAVHAAVVSAKPIVTAFYGKAVEHAYFSGCSTGGHQALMEAQRYAGDFDGIIAGDPGHNRTHLNAGFLWQFVSNHRKTDGAEIIPSAKLAMISAAVLNACRGRDGGLATDKFLTAPEACGFQPRDILCKAADTPDCLTEEQATALATMYGGARNPRTGETIYSGWPKGSENSGRVIASLPGWSLYWADPADPGRPARTNFWKLWAFNDPNWDWKQFDFDAGMKLADDRLASIINAMNPDLSAFQAAGGKLIQYHGLADPVVPPRDSIDYFEEVQRTMAKSASARGDESADFYRLYLVPGMEHCGGGEGANVLDVQRALERWVEQGNAPAQIAATKFVHDRPDDRIAFTRPLCPYPQQARYGGTGDSKDAANFTCAPGHRDPEPLAAASYRR
jgi:feruloyl esterase